MTSRRSVDKNKGGSLNKKLLVYFNYKREPDQKYLLAYFGSNSARKFDRIRNYTRALKNKDLASVTAGN